jgi:hypothetical protein
MSVPLIVFIIALILVIVFFRDFHAFVYYVVVVDIFLRIVTYLKLYIIKDNAFGFLNMIPADVPSIIKAFNVPMANDILMFLYVIVYIIFEAFLITNFARKKF